MRRPGRVEGPGYPNHCPESEAPVTDLSSGPQGLERPSCKFRPPRRTPPAGPVTSYGGTGGWVGITVGFCRGLRGFVGVHLVVVGTGSTRDSCLVVVLWTVNSTGVRVRPRGCRF